jgi:hypothetical protein
MVVETRLRTFYTKSFNDDAKLLKGIQLLNGKDLLIFVSGERESSAKMRRVQCMTYTREKEHFISFIDDQGEEDGVQIALNLNKIERMRLLDWEWGEDFRCHIMFKFNSGNELHIHNAA